MWCSQPANHPQEELAKFGYRVERNFKKINESCYILATFWNLPTYCPNMKISENFLSKSGQFCTLFPLKILGMTLVSGHQMAKIQPQKNTDLNLFFPPMYWNIRLIWFLFRWPTYPSINTRTTKTNNSLAHSKGMNKVFRKWT